MDLWQLNYFMKVVEEGSISAASRKLHMSQPPLSLQIKRLEAELDTPLFLRDGRNLILTEAGGTLYQRAKSLLDLAEVTEKEVRSIAQGTHGILRLGTTSSSCCSQVQSRIGHFHEKFPDISFALYEKDSYSLVEMLRNGQLDAAFVRTPFPQNGLRCLTLNTETLLAAGLPAFFETSQEPVRLSWLQGKPLILYRRWETLLRNAFNSKGLELHPFCINDDARTCLAWARSGLGVTLVPGSALETNGQGPLTVRPVEDLNITSSITLILPTAGSSKMAREFFAYFEKSFSPSAF